MPSFMLESMHEMMNKQVYNKEYWQKSHIYRNAHRKYRSERSFLDEWTGHEAMPVTDAVYINVD